MTNNEHIIDPQSEPTVDSVEQDTTASDTESLEENMFNQSKERIAELEKQLSEVQARANADMYNFQKRIERDADNTKKYVLEKFSKSMLTVVDNLERALQNKSETDSESFIQGIELTYKGLLAELEKHGVIALDPIGKAFDANFHEAVGIDPEAQKDIVGKVLQKGYSLNGRVLRPAIVMVGA